MARRGFWIDWPTVVAMCGLWAALIGAVLATDHLPVAVVLGLLAVLGGFYMSLQHEVIHGHPTASPVINRLLVGVPLGLVQPFSRYRATHLVHHASELTEPVVDPESYYVQPEAWAKAGRLRRVVLVANRTLLFRLTVGPFLAAWRMIRYDIVAAQRDVGVAIAWAIHLAGCAAVLFLVHASGLPVWVYLLGFVYGGQAFTALRSFAEHKAETHGPRSAIVRAGPLLSLLYLNNNLHYTHHQLPGAAWYRLPELSRTMDAEQAASTGAGVYPSYASIARRFIVRPFDQPVYPLSATIKA